MPTRNVADASADTTKTRNGLVGRCFVIWGENREVRFQGYVVAGLWDGHFLVQFFDALVGAPATMAVFHISSFVGGHLREPWTFEFFENNEHLRGWSGYDDDDDA